jgi:hypothetical protein
VEKYCREEQATDDNMAHAQVILRMRNVSDKSCNENQNTLFMSHNFFRKSFSLWHVEKYCSEEQATDDNMAQAHFMLDN